MADIVPGFSFTRHARSLPAFGQVIPICIDPSTLNNYIDKQVLFDFKG